MVQRAPDRTCADGHPATACVHQASSSNTRPRGGSDPSRSYINGGGSHHSANPNVSIRTTPALRVTAPHVADLHF